MNKKTKKLLGNKNTNVTVHDPDELTSSAYSSAKKSTVASSQASYEFVERQHNAADARKSTGEELQWKTEGAALTNLDEKQDKPDTKSKKKTDVELVKETNDQGTKNADGYVLKPVEVPIWLQADSVPKDASRSIAAGAVDYSTAIFYDPNTTAETNGEMFGAPTRVALFEYSSQDPNATYTSFDNRDREEFTGGTFIDLNDAASGTALRAMKRKVIKANFDHSEVSGGIGRYLEFDIYELDAWNGRKIFMKVEGHPIVLGQFESGAGDDEAPYSDMWIGDGDNEFVFWQKTASQQQSNIGAGNKPDQKHTYKMVIGNGLISKGNSNQLEISIFSNNTAGSRSWAIDNVTTRTATPDYLPATNSAPILNQQNSHILDSIYEDITSVANVGTAVSTLVRDSITDEDPGDPRGIFITEAARADGNWEFSIAGQDVWTPVSFAGANAGLGLLLTEDDRIRFVPDANYNGTASLMFGAWDQTSGSAGTYVDVSTRGEATAFSLSMDDAAITVSAVNDAPVLLAGSFELPVVHGSDPTSIAGTTVSELVRDKIIDTDKDALKGIYMYPTNFSDGSWQYRLSGETSWNDIVWDEVLLLRVEDSIRFLPNPDFSGKAGFMFGAWDQTSGVAGPLDLSSALWEIYTNIHPSMAYSHYEDNQLAFVNVVPPLLQKNYVEGYSTTSHHTVNGGSIAPYLQRVDNNSATAVVLGRGDELKAQFTVPSEFRGENYLKIQFDLYEIGAWFDVNKLWAGIDHAVPLELEINGTPVKMITLSNKNEFDGVTSPHSDATSTSYFHFDVKDGSQRSVVMVRKEASSNTTVDTSGFLPTPLQKHYVTVYADNTDFLQAENGLLDLTVKVPTFNTQGFVPPKLAIDTMRIEIIDSNDDFALTTSESYSFAGDVSKLKLPDAPGQLSFEDTVEAINQRVDYLSRQMESIHWKYSPQGYHTLDKGQFVSLAYEVGEVFETWQSGVGEDGWDQYSYRLWESLASKSDAIDYVKLQQMWNTLSLIGSAFQNYSNVFSVGLSAKSFFKNAADSAGPSLAETSAWASSHTGKITDGINAYRNHDIAYSMQFPLASKSEIVDGSSFKLAQPFDQMIFNEYLTRQILGGEEKLTSSEEATVRNAINSISNGYEEFSEFVENMKAAITVYTGLDEWSIRKDLDQGLLLDQQTDKKFLMPSDAFGWGFRHPQNYTYTVPQFDHPFQFHSRVTVADHPRWETRHDVFLANSAYMDNYAIDQRGIKSIDLPDGILGIRLNIAVNTERKGPAQHITKEEKIRSIDIITSTSQIDYPWDFGIWATSPATDDPNFNRWVTETEQLLAEKRSVEWYRPFNSLAPSTEVTRTLEAGSESEIEEFGEDWNDWAMGDSNFQGISPFEYEYDGLI